MTGDEPKGRPPDGSAAPARDRIGLDSLFAGGQEMLYAPGATIFSAGAVADRVYFIRTGLVRVGRLSPDGRELTLALIGPGELLGEVALLDGGVRTAGAMAQTETRLACLTRERLLQAIGGQPEVAVQVILALCQRLRQADQLVEDLTFLGVKERLRNLLDRLEGKDQGALLSALTHQQLAEMIGTSRESVTRALTELRREKE